MQLRDLDLETLQRLAKKNATTPQILDAIKKKRRTIKSVCDMGLHYKLHSSNYLTYFSGTKRKLLTCQEDGLCKSRFALPGNAQHCKQRTSAKTYS